MNSKETDKNKSNTKRKNERLREETLRKLQSRDYQEVVFSKTIKMLFYNSKYSWIEFNRRNENKKRRNKSHIPKERQPNELSSIQEIVIYKKKSPYKSECSKKLRNKNKYLKNYKSQNLIVIRY